MRVIKKAVSLLLSIAILFTFCGARECLAVAGSGDAENPNLLGESVDVSDEMTDALEPVEPKKSFWEKTKKGLECIGGLAAFAGLVAGGGYILNLFKADKVADDGNLEMQVNQIEQMNQTEIANLFFKEVHELENQNDKEEEKEDLEEKVEDLAKKEEEKEDLEEKVKRKELATYSGTCGTNLTWNLDTSTGVLTISGSGAMKDYSWSSTAPWYNNRNSITSVVIGDNVTTIGNYAFYSCGLTKVEIPESVTTIGDYAFYGCSRLTSVEIPGSVTTIGNAAFSACSSLTSVEIPESVTTIGDRAFDYCSSLTSVEIPESVKTIGSGAFSRCSSLTSVEIPESVTTIGDRAFYDCSRLTEINVNENNQYYKSENGVLFSKYGDKLIQYTNGKTDKSYIIPESVTTIGSSAFSYCSSLTSVEIPGSVTTIGSSAFSYCGLTSVTIGNGVTTIGSEAFSECSSLTSVEIPESVTTIGSEAFSECSSLTSVTIGNGVTTIGDYAFDYCSSLTSVEIPESVTTIGSEAFSECSSLTSVTIGNGVTTIGYEAFSYCRSLTSDNRKWCNDNRL